MIENNTEKHKTAYTHTVDFREGALAIIAPHVITEANSSFICSRRDDRYFSS